MDSLLKGKENIVKCISMIDYSSICKIPTQFGKFIVGHSGRLG
jgi:hypothetical protein